MKIKTLIFFATFCIFGARGAEPSILFDFDNAPNHTSLPITLSGGGITAHFTATGQGFSIQPANSLGFTPVGFAGLCIYPNSVFAADLNIGFSRTLTDFSILYAPEEYACDSSARMRVTAYLGGAFAGTSTMTADPPGTWPSATLAITVPGGFDSVVVHYDAAPPTGGDYGPVFMADNMVITPAPPPIVLTDPTILPGRAFQFSFTNTPGATFTVLASTNLSLSRTNWVILGPVIETSPGQFQFTDTQATLASARFYSVRSP
jgi:hypothetical protein